MKIQCDKVCLETCAIKSAEMLVKGTNNATRALITNPF